MYCSEDNKLLNLWVLQMKEIKTYITATHLYVEMIRNKLKQAITTLILSGVVMNTLDEGYVFKDIGEKIICSIILTPPL